MFAVIRRSRIGLMGWSLFVILVICVAYVQAGRWLPGDQEIVILGLQAAFPIGAVGSCFLAARAASSLRKTWSWALMGAGVGLWFVSVLIQLFYSAVLQEVMTETVTLADAAWLLSYPMFFAAIVLQVPRREGGAGQLTTIVDAIIFTVGAAGLSWQFVIGPTLLSGSSNQLTLLVDAAYPAGDIFVILALASSALRWPHERVPLSVLLLLGAGSVMVVVDNLYILVHMAGAYVSPSPIDLLWDLAGMLVAWAALVYKHDRQHIAEPEKAMLRLNVSWTARLRAVLPYLALPAVAVMLLAGYADQANSGVHSYSWLIPVIALLTVGLIVVRQSLILRENGNLSRSLAVMAGRLEDQVVQRTEDVEALHAMATRLSELASAQDVLAAGLNLACQTMRVEGGAIWKIASDGLVALEAVCNLPEDVKPVLETTPQRATFIRDAAVTGRPFILELERLRPFLPDGFEVRWSFSGIGVIPLQSRGQVLGALGLWMTNGRRLSDSDLRFARALGSQLGVALENAQRYEEARNLADRDPVTDLLNHRAIHTRLEEELKRAKRQGHQLSVVMMDLDGFKLFNDTYGHPVGDHVLRKVAGLLAKTCRGSDVLGRYGGDEFVAILTETASGPAVVAAERMRKALSEHPYIADGVPVPVHMSFGIATFPEDGQSVNDLMGFADANMYESKEHGGDIVTSGSSGGADSEIKTGSFGILDGLVKAVDNKDHYTRVHSEEVTKYGLMIARALGLSDETYRTLRLAGLLHDVGKIGVPDRILRKPGRLDEDEYLVVKQHAQLGELIIKEVPNLQEVLEAVGTHHERYDGNGYPRGLCDGNIPLLGRILAVADAYSAMTTDRPYRQAMPHDLAQQELLRVAGTQLDPEIVGVFVEQLKATEEKVVAAQ